MLSIIIAVHVFSFFETLKSKFDSPVIRASAFQRPQMHNRNPMLGDRNKRKSSSLVDASPLNSQEIRW